MLSFEIRCKHKPSVSCPPSLVLSHVPPDLKSRPNQTISCGPTPVDENQVDRFTFSRAQNVLKIALLVNEKGPSEVLQ